MVRERTKNLRMLECRGLCDRQGYVVGMEYFLVGCRELGGAGGGITGSCYVGRN